MLATPTGSGKSLVGVAAHVVAAARGERSVYTAPVKALVNEKFFALCEVFGPEQVGMLTGDATVNPDALVVCATAEVLAHQALRDGPDSDVGLVVMDEFHYYADPDRGWAWQVPLLELRRAQFLLMSATLGDTTDLRAALTRRTGRPTSEVASLERPVPLSFHFSLDPVQEAILELVATHRAPVYVVHPTQAAALEQAQGLVSVPLRSREQRDRIADALAHERFARGFGPVLSRLLRHGVGVHHAGMLPRYRRLVERLAQEGLLAVVCGTDTLGVGVNIPLRTVLMTSLSKYDGSSVRLLTAREFHQIAGRAGRAGFDTAGDVVVQAPQHVIDNERMIAKADGDPRKLRSMRKKTPPPGMVSWGRPTFERLVDAPPEPLRPQLRVTHAMLLQLAARGADALPAAVRLLTDNDETPARRRALVRDALVATRALRAAGVVRRHGPGDLRLAAELPAGFALTQPLSTFALAALELLDPAAPDHHLDVLSVVEATLEDPRQVLSAQRSQARAELVSALKAQGATYEERVAEVEEVTWPRPLAELLEAAYETYAGGHPWVRDHELRPKSVARDLWERSLTFSEYVAWYGLARVEGVVLRYLTDVYRALRQTVPEESRSPALDEVVTWLGTVVRQVDSSLLAEWEALTGQEPRAADAVEVRGAGTPRPLSTDDAALRPLVRRALWRRVDLLARGRWRDLAELDPGTDWEQVLLDYAATYPPVAGRPAIGTGADARGPGLVWVERTVDDDGEPVTCAVQVLDDPLGDHDWRLVAVLDGPATDAAGEVVFDAVRCGPA